LLELSRFEELTIRLGTIWKYPEQFPHFATFSILAALNEEGIDLDLGPQQMLPLIPAR